MKSLKFVGLERRVLSQEQRVRDQRCHRQEVLERIDRHFGVEMRVDPEQRARSQQQRIAVRRRVGGDIADKVAVGARPVLHHDGLAEPNRERLSDRARHQIACASRRERDQEPNGSVGIALRQRTRCEQCSERQSGQSHQPLHRCLPVPKIVRTIGFREHAPKNHGPEGIMRKPIAAARPHRKERPREARIWRGINPEALSAAVPRRERRRPSCRIRSRIVRTQRPQRGSWPRCR